MGSIKHIMSMQLCKLMYADGMKRHKDPLVLAAEVRVRLAERNLTTSSSIARAFDLGQSQVYRNLFGRPKTVSKTLTMLCKHANVDAYEGVVDPSQSQVLMQALATIWDGSESHARKLANLLFAHQRAHV
ncbi:hypothetical protein ABU614_07025 [Lysobacter firmicutimachus]|uniref:XRE family transcriptional regulator n=1 Tax=Lysobacter firmicutimachus TaxID=1792846 RepID=A0AAU8MX11_9GAMM